MRAPRWSTRIPREWGRITAADREREYPCDRYLTGDPYLRAIDVAAPPAVVFRWLCQLRIAPYSYDIIDNYGRRSPRKLVAGLDELEVGQPFMTLFRLVEFERDRHLTILMTDNWLFGDVAVTYWIEPTGRGCRLIGKVVVSRPGWGPGARLVRTVLPFGDLIMMRRQLLNLRALAEASARAELR